MATVFTRIMNGELPGRFVWQDATCAAFLSINPIRRGHTLVVPRREVDHWFDLDPGTVGHLMAVGQHMHLIPISDMGGLDFATAASSVDPAELDVAAEQIVAALRRAGHPEAG